MSHEHDEGISNHSGNRPFGKVLEARHSRRDVLVGGMGAAATAFFAVPGTADAGGNGRRDVDDKWRRRRRKLVGFEPVTLDRNGSSTALPRISDDYEFDTLIPWGDPLEPGGPVFNYPGNASDQALQIGIGHDGMTYFPLSRRHGDDRDDGHDNRGHGWHGWRRGGNSRGLLAINHEFGGNVHVYGKGVPESLEDVRLSQHAHGVAVVEIARRHGRWRTVNSSRARNIHVNTPVTFSGPVAGCELLDTPAGNSPLGTVNNCANGETPWGTYLTCEENFNGYFGATGDWTPTEEQLRYGFTSGGFGYGWENFDPRFDLSNANYRNEEHRFGWVVEIDPYDGSQTPVKRTALGRFKHEGVAVTVGRGGRAVCYMGDDERFDYIYRFVSRHSWRIAKWFGQSPLDDGKLYVARFDDDGSGEWLELSIDNPVLARRFANQAEVLVHARIAGDLLGATPMDRPEWTSVAPNGDVYCTLTNNSQRSEGDAANPLAPNPDGHIIRFRDSRNHTGRHFRWDIFVIAENTHGTEESFASPDGLWADPDGRLFIQTDGGQKDGLNNQMVVADIRTGEISRLFEGVDGDEITGIAVTPDRRTMFINTQHPGNGDPTLTNFPVLNEQPDGMTIPRDCTIVLRRKDGGIIGS